MSPRWATAWNLLRRDPREFAAAFGGEVENYFVYGADPARVAAPAPVAGWTVEKLGDAAFRALPAQSADWRHETDRFEKLGFNDAWILSVDGTPASLGWLLSAAAYRRLPVRFLALRDGEAEIGFCATRTDFRGRGLYPHLIRSLCAVAAASGTRRVFMITGVGNAASQRGIEKAGFARCGTIRHRRLAYLHPNARLIARRYR